MTDSRGQGSRGIRASELPGRSMRIEVVVGAAAAAIHVSQVFFSNSAVFAWLTSVEVLRGDKYV